MVIDIDEIKRVILPGEQGRINRTEGRPTGVHACNSTHSMVIGDDELRVGAWIERSEGTPS